MVKVDTVKCPGNQNEKYANKPLVKECRQNNRCRCKHNDEHVMTCAKHNSSLQQVRFFKDCFRGRFIVIIRIKIL